MLASQLSLSSFKFFKLMDMKNQMFMFSNQITSMKINLFAKHVAENTRESFFDEHSNLVVKVKVFFPFTVLV